MVNIIKADAYHGKLHSWPQMASHDSKHFAWINKDKQTVHIRPKKHNILNVSVVENSHISSVIVVTMLDDQGLILNRGQLWGPIQLPMQWVWGEGGVLSPGVNKAECKLDNSPPSGAKTKNAWSYTSWGHIFMARCLMKHQGKFTLIYSTEWSSPYTSQTFSNETTVLHINGDQML